MNVDDILSKLQKVSKKGNGWMACCPAHEDKSPSLSVSVGKNGVLMKCFAGCSFGDIADALHLQPSDLFFDSGKQPDFRKPQKPIPAGEPKIVAEFSYTDAFGKELYRVERWEPGRNGKRKDFIQKHSEGGKWINGMAGVHRVLYRLPEVEAVDTVWIVEGEGKVEVLRRMGIAATCCVGGSNGWLDGYSDQLAGKHIVLCPDNDEPGKEFAKKVQNSIAGKVASVRYVKVPEPHNDVADWYDASNDEVKLGDELVALSKKATVYNRGYDIPIYSMGDMEARYIEFVNRTATTSFDFGNWLPMLRQYIRPLVPGELFTILAETGVGKTMLLQNIALKARGLTTLLFEMELPDTLTFERFVGMAAGHKGEEVERIYRDGKQAKWRESEQASRVYVCPRSGLTPASIRELIGQSELVIGAKPSLVLIDYIQLVNGAGTRRERIADAAEQLKVIAKQSDCIIGVASQVSRKGEDAGGEIYLNDGKEAGEIENSSGLVLGAWRDRMDSNILKVRALKQTKGKPMITPLDCRITDSLRIHEIEQRYRDRASEPEMTQGAIL